MSYSLALFSLEGVRPRMHAQARAAARRGDPSGIFGCEDSNMSLDLLLQNWDWFLDNDLFEKALLNAWSNHKVVPRWFQPRIREALEIADQHRLMEHSDPLPDGDEFVVYRGVQKGGPRGVSWTLDIKVAQYFSNWLGLGGTVYKTVVKRSDICAYLHEGYRGEKEVLLLLDDDHLIEVFEKVEARS